MYAFKRSEIGKSLERVRLSLVGCDLEDMNASAAFCPQLYKHHR